MQNQLSIRYTKPCWFVKKIPEDQIMQNQPSIRYKKACWFVNKDPELKTTESKRATIAREFVAFGLMTATRSPSLCYWSQKQSATFSHRH